MIIGTTIIHDGTGTTPYHSPEFPRGGLAALFSADVTHKGGSSPSLIIGVQHKNQDETTWATSTSFTAITSTGQKTKDVEGLKELIRFIYTFDAGSLGDFYHLLMQAPVWRPE